MQTNQSKINFLSIRKYTTLTSIVVLSISIFSIFFKGLNLGIDFTGGLLLEVSYDESANLTEIRSALVDGGFENPLVQNFGTTTDVLIRLSPQDQDGGIVRDQALNLLFTQDSSVQLRRIEFVGPQVGEDLTEQGGVAMLIALILIFIYVMFRFRWKFAAGTICALFHDCIIVLGVFSLFGFSFDLTVLAAILATIGYSLNDTIVVFDRIRENFRVMRREAPVNIINYSLNQIIARTIITSLTTMIVLFALFILGGESVSEFARALIIGVFVGTYSSIYIASAAILYLNITVEDLMPPKREEEEDTP
jgi:preprotein translocase subunit SecF|tara:strand:- start:2940 stop:3860 length:921 start_codon:yes stop_codon:yes gene_type:complete